MKTLSLQEPIESTSRKCSAGMMVCASLFLFSFIAPISTALAQTVLFDFDNAPIHTSLPIDQTAGGITAHLRATGQGYSIQEANVLGFTPPGFAGLIIYPNSINLADLLVRFDHMLTDFSIMYSVHELGCDTSATLRVTAYRNGGYVGTNTMVARNPGTWPVDMLRCSFLQGFDSVVVHYASPPGPMCQDYGTIFMADNMRVTPTSTGVVSRQQTAAQAFVSPNPIRHSATISFSLLQPEHVSAAIYDITGKLVKHLFDGQLYPGEHQLHWNASDDAVANGVYFLRLSGMSFSRTHKLVVVR